MKVFLIGLPGSGKTTVGKQLAERLRITFIDLDAELEKLEEKTVQEIFAEKTESYFRELEAKTLKSFCGQKKDFVMATGGGTPGFFDNMMQMNQSGKTVFLDVPTAEICARLQKTNLSTRPLFSDLNLEQLKAKIDLLRSQRIDFYKQASVIISNEITAEEIWNRIKD
jgi:shikimate kinase